MNPIAPAPPPPPPLPLRRPQTSRLRRALEIAWNAIVSLVVLGAAGGIAYAVATGQI
jgi:hypothetical protein